jgi:mannitol/fructose-specific phosphotransferase system IIA component
MENVRVIVSLPRALKAKLDALRRQGYTASGYIRTLLERDLNQPTTGRKGGVHEDRH